MWIMVPVKGFTSAKQRLTGTLSSMERQELAQAMIADVLAVLTRHPDVQGVTVVADEPAAGWLAQSYPVALLREEELGVRGLNRVVMAALDQLARQGVQEVMVMHGDLPLISASDLDVLLQAHRQKLPGAAVGVTDRRGTGTNALVLPLPMSWPLSFGPDSWQRHRTDAQAAGVDLQAVAAAGLQFDVDLAEDLNDLLHTDGPGPAVHTRRLLERLRPAIPPGNADPDKDGDPFAQP